VRKRVEDQKEKRRRTEYVKGSERGEGDCMICI
jgi:hypothetical protein